MTHVHAHNALRACRAEARCFQHELDHLDGILYTERMVASSLLHVSLLETDGDEVMRACAAHLQEGQ